MHCFEAPAKVLSISAAAHVLSSTLFNDLFAKTLFEILKLIFFFILLELNLAEFLLFSFYFCDFNIKFELLFLWTQFCE